MKKGKWSLQATITIFVCAVVALSLLITDLLISQTVAESIEDTQSEKAGNTARMMAHSPVVIEGLSGKGDDRDIQNFANEIQSVTNVEFVVVMDMEGIRKSHPDPNKVGKRFVGGDEEVVLKGKEHVSISEGTLGVSLRSFTPVFDSDGKQIGAVAVGISLDKVNEAVKRSRGDIYIGTLLGILTGIVGAVVLARYIKKILFGLEPFAISKLLEERSAMLQSVREGIIAVDQDAKITLVNKTALGLLQKAGLDENPVGKKIDAYMVTSKLSRVLETGQVQLDEEQNLNGVMLLANRVPVLVDNKIVGAVATFRDKTEISQLAEQLTGVRLYAEALRAQSHEFMNKLHVILGMVHMRYYDKLAAYISEISDNSKNEIGFIARKIKDPVLAGFLIGKLSFAREAGAKLMFSSEFQLPEPEDTSVTHELITIIGNLIDNALEAVQKSPIKQIEVEFDFGDEILTVEVKDTGIGMDKQIQNHILQKGFSTKGENRGYGLYLVNESLQKLGGDLDISSKIGQGTTFVVYIPYKSKGDTK
ncbi:DcuS/MalK family sensor histidine kinase [Metabacillus sediminilitoris]|uniref:histidine kinase n=1 Tax=Metabacillus sediminilitoris TaxID=2567941 RepID=A0A4S4BNN5_9BACI|nr:DcuS/MalK family sensor histidine kinase [Metabacillus sediminilitoris]QGQ45119.1 two-component system sensor histidine kinase DcuS [Metabacillus sediminilitoris]THF76486.1 two-component system sensor histidine kinase DcuS [Metabacillus sediminilitoris]